MTSSTLRKKTMDSQSLFSSKTGKKKYMSFLGIRRIRFFFISSRLNVQLPTSLDLFHFDPDR